MIRQSKADTIQTAEHKPFSIKNYQGLTTSINKGYITFCKKKVNALGKKCNRLHLLPNSEHLYNQDFSNPNKSD
tara:strand:- start:900 stop:1121 length:222 start_codon:yes stop_codon:yes gene_type:complete